MYRLVFFRIFEFRDEVVLDFCEGEIGPGSLDDSSKSVARSAEATGEAIWVVEGCQIVVDFFHVMEESFGFGEVSGAHLVEDESAHF